MAEPSSPASSGGEGYTFEDRVGAWWLLHILDGTLPFDVALGPVHTLRLQTRADGDLLDDNVLGCMHGTARISVKSNQQISAQRAPADFVEACWDQVVNLGDDFDPRVDRLVLVCRGLTRQNHQAKERALAAALGSPERLLDRIMVDGVVQRGARDFIASFGHPTRLGVEVGARTVGWLLQAVRVEDFDFRASNSRMKAQALGHAQRLVTDGSISSAEVLWAMLCQLVRDGSGRAAEYGLGAIVRHLRGKVALQPHPVLAVYWEHLARRDEMFVSRNMPGQGALPLIDRAKTAAELRQTVIERRWTALLGESGVGKSALLAALSPAEAVIYRLSLDELVDEHARWQQNGVVPSELFRSHPSLQAWLVIDGAEWMLSTAQIRAVVDVVRALALDDDGSPWRLVVGCTSPQWHRVRRELGLHHPDSTFDLPSLTSEQLATVGAVVPSLTHLLRRTTLLPLLGNLKVLSLVAEEASASETTPDSSAWAGEASLIDWLWQGLLDENPAFPRELEVLAREQAQQRSRKLPEANLDASTHHVVSSLVERGTLVRHNSTIQFPHDLWGDYGRQKWLLGQLEASATVPFEHLATNALWHRAIRLVGLHLLEVGAVDDGTLTYEALLESPERAKSDTATDLLLESVAFAANPAPMLARLQPLFSRDSARLLRRFLVRFRHSTSVPDPRAMDAAFSPSSQLHLASSWRLPNAPLWSPVIAWLVQLDRNTRRGLVGEIVSLAELWILPPAWGIDLPHVADLASVTLDLVEDHREESQHLRDGIYERLLRVMLRGGRHHRERLRRLVVHLSGRAAPTATGPNPADASHARFWPERAPKTAWPIGPNRPADDDFRTVILTQPGASFLAQTSSELAAEAFLAVLVEPPEHRDVGVNSMTRYVNIGFMDFLDLDPPFHSFAPARALLESNPKRGLVFIRQLLEFATKRWEGCWASRTDRHQSDAPAFHLTIEGRSTPFLGDETVYCWGRAGVDANQSVQAALMALEQWLYELVDEGDGALAEVVGELLTWKSAAVLGVLSDLALKYPQLLNGPLEWLVTSDEIHRMSVDRGMLDQTLDPGMIPWTFGFRYGAERAEEARAWHAQEHRRLLFTHVTAQLLESRDRAWPVLEAAVEVWRSKAAILEEGSTRRLHIEEVSAFLDAKTWVQIELPDGRQGWRWTLPTHVEERNAALAVIGRKGLLWLQLPDACLRWLTGVTELKTEFAELLDIAREGFHNPEQQQQQLTRCAIGAVVATMADQGWIESQEGLREECTAWVVAGLHPDLTLEGAAPWQPKPPEFYTEVRVRVPHLRTLQAVAIPKLWALDPADRVLRRGIALLATCHTQAATELVFRGVAQEVGFEHPDFRQLVHLGVQYARLQMEVIADTRASRPSFVNTNGPASQIAALAAHATHLVDSFVAGTAHPVPSDWLATRIAEQVRPALPGFWDPYLVSTFAWLWDAAELEAGDARSWARGMLVALQRSIWTRVEARLEETGRSRVRPDDSHREVCRIAGLWLYTETDESVRDQLLAVWLEAHRGTAAWFEKLVGAAFDEALQAPAPTHAGLSGTRALLRNALAVESEGLRSEVVKGLEDPGVLIGCPDYGVVSERWTAERSELADVLMEFLPAWAEVFLGHYTAIVAFLRLSRSPAFRVHRPRLLQLLADHDVANVIDFRRDLGELTLTLDQAWRDNNRELQIGPAREAFDALLHHVVGRQVPEALELADRVAAGVR